MYGIASPAPVCTDETKIVAADGQVECQVVQAPEAPRGARLVVETLDGPPRITGGIGGVASVGSHDEIRLTYRELTALIEDAVRNLR
jgi:hypothetical protein